jgi:hypothetical protein
MTLIVHGTTDARTLLLPLAHDMGKMVGVRGRACAASCLPHRFGQKRPLTPTLSPAQDAGEREQSIQVS